MSHGQIAFGFFNIDSDMLLLENYFFFAQEFCKYICEISDYEDGFEKTWEVYYIEKPEEIGDLMGAIHGVRFTGFIGETYRLYPFPERQEDFKQKPEGFETQTVFKEIISRYANRIKIPFTANPEKRNVKIGDYVFTRDWFHELIKYVWIGGMPRWRNEERPDYVLDMKRSMEQSKHWLLAGLKLE
jgi:hypothetical protein